jgi:hypothetical protein
MYYVTRTKHDCTLAQCIFNWNTSITDPKEGRVGFSPAQTTFKANCKLLSQIDYVYCWTHVEWAREGFDNFLLCTFSYARNKQSSKRNRSCSLYLQARQQQNVIWDNSWTSKWSLTLIALRLRVAEKDLEKPPKYEKPSFTPVQLSIVQKFLKYSVFANRCLLFVWALLYCIGCWYNVVSN